MIVGDSPAVPETVSGSQRELLDAVSKHVAASPDAFEAATRTLGFEVRRAAAADRPAGRPRIYFFAEGADRVVAFFYKPSRLSFSHDRFSYGALYLYGRALDFTDSLDEALEYLSSDFKPAKRPRKLKRSLSFTVPDA